MRQLPLTHHLAAGPFETQTQYTQIAMAVMPEGAIADEICPRVRSPYKFTYTKLDTEDRLRIPDVAASRAGELNEVEFGTEDVTDSTLPYGLIDPVPQRDIDEAGRQMVPFDPLADASESTAYLVKLAREKRVGDLVTTAANYAAGYSETLAGNNQWSNAASDPINAVLTAADKLLLRPNTFVMGRAVWTKFRQHPRIVEAVNMSGAGNQAAGAVAMRAVADLLEVERLEIGDLWANSAKKGQDASYGRIWGKHAALLHINRQMRGSNDKRPTFCFTAEAQPIMVGTHEAPLRGVGNGSTVVKVSEECKEVVSWNTLGYLWRSAVA